MEIVQENQSTNNNFVPAFSDFAKERIVTSGKTSIGALHNHFREWLKVMSVWYLSILNSTFMCRQLNHGNT